MEVNRPNRQLRRLRGGKSDSVDAEGAARAAASGQATAVPKSGDGPVECIRMLVVARRSATKARTQAANQIHSLVVTAPEQGQTPTRCPQAQGQGASLCPLASRPSTDHHRLREEDSAPPGPPIPIPRRGDRRTRHRDQRSLREGEPGLVGRHRCLAQTPLRRCWPLPATTPDE